MKNTQKRVPSVVLQNLKKLQADNEEARVVSFGLQNGGSSFLDEYPRAMELGFSIKNTATADKKIAITAGHVMEVITGGTSLDGGGAITLTKESRFVPAGILTATEILSMVGANAFLGDGSIDTSVTVTTKNGNRKINQVLAGAAKSPFRFTRFSMSSYKNDGSPESTNYNETVKTRWISPFEDTLTQEFSFRPILKDKFQAELRDLDFQRDAPNLIPIISPEHVMVITVKGKTTLDINAYVGAQLSIPQWFYRMGRQADNILRIAEK